MKNIQTRKILEFGITKNTKSLNVILFSKGYHKGNVLKNLLKMLKIIHIEINNIEKLKNKFISMPIFKLVDSNLICHSKIGTRIIIFKNDLLNWLSKFSN